jgi:hypothetical protein
MSVSKYKTWVANEILTSADLNASFDQVFNNQGDLGTPRTASYDMDGKELILDADADSSITADTDDRIDFRMQGQDLVKFDGTTASAVNGVTVLAAATGNPAEVRAQGSDTNVGLVLASKGTSNVVTRVNSVDVLTVDGSTASSVNGVTVKSAAAGGISLISATGSDTNVQLSLASKGTDPITLRVGSTDIISGIVGAGTIVNGVTVVGAVTGSPPEIRSTGSDTNVSILIQPKGSGTISLNGAVVTATPSANNVPITDSNGKLVRSWLALDAILLGTYTPSGAATVDITSKITSAYSRYAIWLNLRPSNDGAAFTVRTSVNNSTFDSGASNYPWVVVTDATKTNSSDTSGIIVASTIGNATNEGVAGCLYIDFLGSASMYPVLTFRGAYLDQSTVLHTLVAAVARASAAAINAVQLTVGTTCTGSVEIYGMANS